MSWESNKYYTFWVRVCVCVCILSYPACKAHAPYCFVICGLPRSTIFFHVITQTTRFSRENKLLNTKCVLIFSTNFDWNISNFKNKWAKYYHKFTYLFRKVAVIFLSSNVKIFSTCFRDKIKKLQYQINTSPSSGNRVVPCGRTDRHDEANSRFSQFYECAPKNERSHLWMGISVSDMNRVIFGLLKASASKIKKFHILPHTPYSLILVRCSQRMLTASLHIINRTVYVCYGLKFYSLWCRNLRYIYIYIYIQGVSRL